LRCFFIAIPLELNTPSCWKSWTGNREISFSPRAGSVWFSRTRESTVDFVVRCASPSRNRRGIVRTHIRVHVREWLARAEAQESVSLFLFSFDRSR
jgi:hypothetical protein